MRCLGSLRIFIPFLVIAVFASLSGLSLYRSLALHEKQVMEGLHQRARAEVQWLARQVERVSNTEPRFSGEELAPLTGDPLLQAAMLIDSRGIVRFSIPPALRNQVAQAVVPEEDMPALSQARHIREVFITESAAAGRLVATMSYALPGELALSAMNTGVAYLAYDATSARANAKTAALQERAPDIAALLVTALTLIWMLQALIVRPLGRMRQAALDMSEGKFHIQLEERGPEDIRALATSLNRLGGRFAGQVEHLSRQGKLTQAILDNALDGIITINERGIVTSFSKAAQRIFGFGSAEVIGENVNILMPEPYRGAHDTYLHNYCDTGVARIIGIGREVEGQRKDGRRFPMDLSVSEIHEAGQRLFIGLVRDISERKAAEQKQNHTTRMLDSIVENIPNMIFLKRAADLRFELFNRAGEELFGQSRDALLGKNDYDMFPREQADFFTQKDREVLDSDEVLDIAEENIETAHGPRILHTKKIALRDEQGRPQYLLGISEDITVRKQIEQELVDAQAIAHLSSFQWYPLTGELHWSDEHYRLMGLQPRSVVPSQELLLQIVHPDDRERMQNNIATALASKGAYDSEYRVVRPGGEERYVHTRGRISFDGSGRAVRMIGTALDITDSKRAEQALLAARDEAERANRAKSEFLSSMSHELRTPMNAILGFGQLLEFDDSLSGEQQDNVQEIMTAGHRLLELINAMLNLDAIESGNISLSLESVDVDRIVEDCLKLVDQLATERSIRIARSGLREAIVRADTARLRHALLNLLSNAIKFNHEGGAVTIDVRREGSERLRIRVTDTGPGIARERRAGLFQPFNRLGVENSSIAGAGIGLTVARRLVEMMDGSLDMESQIGSGSTFWIELPLGLPQDSTQAPV